MTPDTQLELIKGLAMEFYYSFVYYLSCHLRDMRQSEFTPAKSLLLRLRLPSHEDYFNLHDYNGNEKIYKLMINLKQSMGSYNHEVDLAISASKLITEVKRKLLYNPLRMIRMAMDIGNEVLDRMPYFIKRFKYNGQWIESIRNEDYFRTIVLQELFSKHVMHYCKAEKNSKEGLCNKLCIPSEWKDETDNFNAVYLAVTRLTTNAITAKELYNKILPEKVNEYKESVVLSLGKSEEPLVVKYIAKLENDNDVIDADFLFTMMCIDAVIEKDNIY